MIPRDDITQQRPSTRRISASDVETGGALVDHLRRMGVSVTVDLDSYRRTLHRARKDNSLAGRIRYMKNTDGRAYGFSYQGRMFLDLAKVDGELPIHEYAHLWCESFRYLNKQGWSHIVDMMKRDSDSWNFIKGSCPEIMDDDNLAEEAIATFSGKRGAERLRAELQRMAVRDDVYKSRWSNIFQNVSKCLQDFWKQVGPYMGIRYHSKEEICDRVLKDFVDGVNPRKDIERYLKARDVEYMDAVQSGNMSKATAIFTEALKENIGNGMTPFVTAGNYRSLRHLARKVKDSNREALEEAAGMMAPLVPPGAVLVPAPSHIGKASDMLALSHVIAGKTGAIVADVLVSSPRKSQYEYKCETGKPMLSDELGITAKGRLPKGRLPIVIDNVISSGNTAEACIRALGTGVMLSLANADGDFKRAASLRSARPVLYDKSGHVVPLSHRFHLSLKGMERNMVKSKKAEEPLEGSENGGGKIQGLEGYSIQEIRQMVLSHVEDVISMYMDENDVLIKDITLIGSRTRGEARDGSDLDVLIEYEGDIREDSLFNLLSSEPMAIEGIRVDANPINPRYSLSTSQWLERDRQWRQEDRLTDIRVFESKGNKRISAKVDGRQMLAKTLKGEDARVGPENAGLKKLAAKYYEKELNGKRERKNSMKI